MVMDGRTEELRILVVGWINVSYAISYFNYTKYCIILCGSKMKISLRGDYVMSTRSWVQVRNKRDVIDVIWSRSICTIIEIEYSVICEKVKRAQVPSYSPADWSAFSQSPFVRLPKILAVSFLPLFLSLWVRLREYLFGDVTLPRTVPIWGVLPKGSLKNFFFS